MGLITYVDISRQNRVFLGSNGFKPDPNIEPDDLSGRWVTGSLGHWIDHG